MKHFDYRDARYELRDSWGDRMGSGGFEIFDQRCAWEILARSQTRAAAEKIVKALNDVEEAKAEVERMCLAARAA